LGHVHVNGVAYQFGVRGVPPAWLRGRSNDDQYKAALQLLRFMSRRIAEALPHHGKLATEAVNAIWLAFDAKKLSDAVRASPANSLVNSFQALGVAAELADNLGDLFNVRGLSQAAVTVGFVAERGGNVMLGEAQCSQADALSYALELRGEGVGAECLQLIEAALKLR
jgi:hypothetical protein